MKCPKCGATTSKIIYTEQFKEWRTRRRVCTVCGGRFTTREVIMEKGKQNG